MALWWTRTRLPHIDCRRTDGPFWKKGARHPLRIWPDHQLPDKETVAELLHRAPGITCAA